MKCIIAIVKLAAELAFCGCYTTTSAPEYSRIFRKSDISLPFWHSKFSFIANSLLLPHLKALEKTTKIGWKSAKNRPLAVKIAIIPCTLSPSAGCSTESDLQRSPRHQRYPPFWQSGVPLLHDYLWLWLFIYWFRDWLIDLSFFLFLDA